jgi:hypothetical protein
LVYIKQGNCCQEEIIEEIIGLHNKKQTRAPP